MAEIKKKKKVSEYHKQAWLNKFKNEKKFFEPVRRDRYRDPTEKFTAFIRDPKMFNRKRNGI